MREPIDSVAIVLATLTLRGHHVRGQVRQSLTSALFLPKRRGIVSLSNLQALNVILYAAEHGCKWRGLPERFRN